MDIHSIIENNSSTPPSQVQLWQLWIQLQNISRPDRRRCSYGSCGLSVTLKISHSTSKHLATQREPRDPSYSLVKINCNAGQQNAILPLCSLFTSYSCTVGTQYFMWAPLAPSKLFNCFTVAYIVAVR